MDVNTDTRYPRTLTTDTEGENRWALINYTRTTDKKIKSIIPPKAIAHSPISSSSSTFTDERTVSSSSHEKAKLVENVTSSAIRLHCRQKIGHENARNKKFPELNFVSG